MWVTVIVTFTDGEKREYEDIKKDSICIENEFLKMESIYNESYYVNLANSIDLKIKQ